MDKDKNISQTKKEEKKQWKAIIENKRRLFFRKNIMYVKLFHGVFPFLPDIPRDVWRVVSHSQERRDNLHVVHILTTAPRQRRVETISARSSALSKMSHHGTLLRFIIAHRAAFLPLPCFTYWIDFREREWMRRWLMNHSAKTSVDVQETQTPLV